MSVQSSTSQIQYMGNGSKVTPYPIPFYFLSGSDIVVQKTDLLENVSTLVNGVDYTVIGAGVIAGGSLKTAVAYDGTYILTISRVIPYTQPASYATAGPFQGSSHETALDRLVMMVQQLARTVAKSVRGSDASGDIPPFPKIPATNIWIMSVVNGVLTWILPSTASIGNGTVVPAHISQSNTPAWLFQAVVNGLSGFVGNLTGNVTGNVTGNASTSTSAAKWTTARTITLSGDVSGTASIDGSDNITISTSGGLGSSAQSWHDVTSSRASGTIYTNSTGKPILVMVTTFQSTSLANLNTITINGTQFGYVSSTVPSGSNTVTTFIVPAGQTYKVTTANPAWMLQWSELY